MVLRNFDLLWKQYGTMEKKYGTIEKIWYYEKYYGSISRNMEL